MRHIVEYDPETLRWAVVDTESAHLVISLSRHPRRGAKRRRHRGTRLAVAQPDGPGARGLIGTRLPASLDAGCQVAGIALGG